VATKTAAKTTTRKTAAKKTAPASPLGPIPAGSNRRKEIEDMLLSLGITDITYREQVPLTEFSVDASLNNQARFKQLDEHVVERYTEAWKRGDKFPPVIAHRRGKSLINSDGNHRLASSLSADIGAMDVYEIKAPAKTIAVLTMMANSKHGLPTNIEERVAHAIYLMDNGLSRVAAAERMQVPVKEIDKRYKKIAADRRARSAGVLDSDWNKINVSLRDRLQTVNTDEGLVATVKFCIAANIGADEINDIIKEVNQSRSGSGQVAIVRTLEAAYADRIEATAGGALVKGKTKALGPKGRLRMALGQIAAIPEDPRDLVAAYAVAERHETATAVRAQAKKLEAFADALEA